MSSTSGSVIKFNMGDTAWAIGYEGQHQVKKDCPICFGKFKVVLILGNDDRIELDCDYCGKGYEGPKGYVLEWEYKVLVELVTITGMEIDQDKIRYKSRNRIYDELFVTRAEAEAKSQQLIDKRLKDEITRAEFLKKHQNKSYSWNAGYHLREVKECEKRIEYHRKKAVICKQRSKGKDGDA